MHVVVVGAGAFGGWTALFLRRLGVRVTLLDAWGPANARASSGGETRVIRGTYGSRRINTFMAARALVLWSEHERRWRRQLYHPIGVLWLVGDDDRYEQASLPLLREAGLPFEELSAAELAVRYPQINLAGVRWGLLETNAGYLLARRACDAVVEGFRAEGGEFCELAVRPPVSDAGELQYLTLADGTTCKADAYVFACGPWLARLFPAVLGDLVKATRQEVFFFGTPEGDARFSHPALPVWADHGQRFVYGIPGNAGRGFKVADDTRGPEFDPTSGDRLPSTAGLAAARGYLAKRFPALRDAPLVDARVCQYENTPDEEFIVDRHPTAGNVWLVGGGSGHGFKHGPAVGEMVARLLLGEAVPDPAFRLSRFSR